MVYYTHACTVASRASTHLRASAQPIVRPINGPFSRWGSKVSTNCSNTWKHACYCAFLYTFTEKHVCFHVIYLRASAQPIVWPINGPFFRWGSKVSTKCSNTWKHACYCAFLYTFTEKHVCFHIIYLHVYLVLTFDPGSIPSAHGCLLGTLQPLLKPA